MFCSRTSIWTNWRRHLRAAVAANTSIKLAGGVSDKDARALASDMRTLPNFISSMRKHPRSTEFACFVRNVSANAMRIQIPFGSVEAAPKMRDAQFAQLIARNRARYASSKPCRTTSSRLP